MMEKSKHKLFKGPKGTIYSQDESLNLTIQDKDGNKIWQNP